jgi:ADP-heptose:LPS heptosyltransferase
MNRNLLITLDKTIFKLFFYLIVLISKFKREAKNNYRINLENPERFLVIRPGGAGDGIMSIPLLKALRKNFPKSRITLLCVKKSKAGLQLTDLYDELYTIDNFKRSFKNLKAIFKSPYNVVFDLEQFRIITSVISYLTGSKIRIGFDTNNRRLLYTHFVTYANDKQYESINFINQLKVIGVEIPYEEAVDITFKLSQQEIDDAGKKLREKDINPGFQNTVAVFPGVLKAHHRWKMNEFAALTDLIIDEDENAKVLLMGTSDDIADTREVIKLLKNKNKVLDLTGKLNFTDALAVLTFCRIIIACDGGAVYMGAAMGCATISLWGPGVMERFKPPGKKHIGVRKDYFCIPCVNYSRLGEFPRCPYNRRCLNDITAEEVFNKYLFLKNTLLEK